MLDLVFNLLARFRLIYTTHFLRFVLILSLRFGSGPISLPFLGSFHLSFALLVCYRFPGHIYNYQSSTWLFTQNSRSALLSHTRFTRHGSAVLFCTGLSPCRVRISIRVAQHVVFKNHAHSPSMPTAQFCRGRPIKQIFALLSFRFTRRY